MDPKARAALERELRALSDDFAAQLPRRQAEIAAAWRDCEHAGWTGEPSDRLYRLCHNLAGAGGTFGFDAVGLAARALTDWLKEWRRQPDEARPAPRADLLAALDETIHAVQSQGA